MTVLGSCSTVSPLLPRRDQPILAIVQSGGVVITFSPFRSSELRSPSEVFLLLAPMKVAQPWLLKRFWPKSNQLHNVSTRLEGLAEQHPLVSEGLITMAGNVRSTATVLTVLVATKLHGDNGHSLSDLG